MSDASVDEDFVQYARQRTDAQLRYVLLQEYKRINGNYAEARIAAAERGWKVVKGEQIGDGK